MMCELQYLVNRGHLGTFRHRFPRKNDRKGGSFWPRYGHFSGCGMRPRPYPRQMRDVLGWHKLRSTRDTIWKPQTSLQSKLECCNAFRTYFSDSIAAGIRPSRWCRYHRRQGARRDPTPQGGVGGEAAESWRGRAQRQSLRLCSGTLQAMPPRRVPPGRSLRARASRLRCSRAPRRGPRHSAARPSFRRQRTRRGASPSVARGRPSPSV